VISLPVILFEMYGFVLPAFSPRERRIAMPLLAAIPFLFVIGVAFGYFVVLPAALRFFQNFNSSEFNVLVQAAPYYKFVATILLAMGLVFQVPIAILAATRVGIVTPKQLRHNRRYAVVACAGMAAFLPGDAVTLLLETIPLYILYELSILIATHVARRDAKRELAEAALQGAGGDAPPAGPSGPGGVAAAGPMPSPPSGPMKSAEHPLAGEDSDAGMGEAGAEAAGARDTGAGNSGDEVEPDVKQIIDHIDRELS
jgi:hypothetical protein